MAVISNTTEEGPVHLKALDLAKYFDFLVTSFEVGYEKPDPRIFEVALERANVRPSEAIHVGNLVKADVEGARGVGITPVLIDRNSVHEHVECVRIESLGGIFDILFPE